MLAFLSKVKGKIYIFVLIYVFSLFLSGCDNPKSSEQEVLENSVSVIKLTRGREVDRYIRDKSPGLTGTIYAKIRIEYEPISPYSKTDVYDEIVATLLKDDWERDEWNIDNPNYFSASMKKKEFPLFVVVRIYPEKNLVNIRMTNMNP